MAHWYRIPVVKDIGHALIYFPARGLVAALSCLPRSVIRPICIALADTLRFFDRHHTRIALANLKDAFPEKSTEECRTIVREIYRHLSLILQDTVIMWREKGDEVLERLVDSPDLTQVRELSREGKGLILVTGHLGNWEIAGNTLSTIFPVNGLSREFTNPHIRRFIYRYRKAFGQKIVYAKKGLEPMLECLARNECLALLPDKRLRSSRLPVAFFGRIVRAPTSPAILAWRSGAPILTGASFRIGHSSRFRLESGALIRPDHSMRKGAEIRRMTQAYMSSLEDLIRRHPEQWIWVHDRWKYSQPLPAAGPREKTGTDTALRSS